jgi:hypothetical protein
MEAVGGKVHAISVDLLSPTGVGGWAETELGLNLADERRRVVTLVEDMSSFWE